jgi:phage-related protein
MTIGPATQATATPPRSSASEAPGTLHVVASRIAWLYKNLYYSTMKPLDFRGSSLDDLRAFPRSAIREAGHQLDRVQHGLMPDDAKPMSSIGKGVVELRIWDEAGTFRVVYVAKFEDAVYVLHCFQKKTQQTARKDIDLAAKRFKELLKEIAP